MTARELALVDAMLRQDLAAFVQRCFLTVVPGQIFLPNWHVEAICHQLERVWRGDIRRLIITLPPRNLKSICASVAFPAFVLGHDPTQRIVCLSYSYELAAKHARDSRITMECDWYKRIFPHARIDQRRNSVTEFEMTARGGRLTTSVGGTLTGRGGNLIIIDDPMKPADAMSDTARASNAEWYDSTLSSRLDSKTEDAIVIIMQRLHMDDLVGHVLEKSGSWTHLNLPAIAESPQEIELGSGATHKREIGDVLHPDRESISVLNDLKVDLGSQSFSAQYQQAPVPAGGAMVKRHWFRSYACAPHRQSGDRIVQSWDTASKANDKNDYSVGTAWLIRGSDYFLVDVRRKRLEFPDLRREIDSYAQVHKTKTVLIEDAGSGTGLIQELRREGKIRPIAIRPERDKITRLEAQSAAIEAGHVLLPRSAPWLDEFLLEVLAFPHGRFDDQVDSLSQFLTWVAKPWPRVNA